MAENFCKEIGKVIKNRREELGLTLKELSVRALVPEEVLEALEAGKAGTLPEPVYVRGFLKRIAKVLDIEEMELLKLFEKCEFSSSVVADIKDIAVKKRKKEKESIWTYATIGFAVVLAVIVFFYINLVHNFNSGRLSVEDVSVVAENKTLPAKGLGVKEKAKGSESEAKEQASDHYTEAFIVSVKGTIDKCWYKFISSNQTSQGFVEAGEVIDFKCVDSCTLRLGNPKAVVLFKDNQKIAIPTIKPVTIEFTKTGVKIF